MGISKTVHVFPLSKVPRVQHMQRSAHGVHRLSSAASFSTCACKCAANAGMTQFTDTSLHQSEKMVIHGVRDSFFHGVALDTAHVCTSCASRVHHVCTCVCTYVCTCVLPHFLSALKKTHIYIIELSEIHPCEILRQKIGAHVGAHVGAHEVRTRCYRALWDKRNNLRRTLHNEWQKTESIGSKAHVALQQ